MSEQERQAIVTKIEDLKKQMKEVKGTPTECYSRVVGYLRPVQSWNKGKKEEFGMRCTYNVENCACCHADK